MDASLFTDKTLVMIVGPTAIGKSTLMNEAIRQDQAFSRVKSFTTRPPRSDDDPNHYFYFSSEDLSSRIDAKKIITDAVFPTTGFHYGTIAESFQNEYNLLDTLANSVDTYKALPFKRKITFSVTAPGNAWEQWFQKRYPVITDEARQRLAEAKLSLKWSLRQPDMLWLVNELDDVSTTAHHLIAVSRGQAQGLREPLYANSMLQTIDTLLS
jgi:guanylate kinase